MLQILLHSSKTMTDQRSRYLPLATPPFMDEAEQLVKSWQRVHEKKIAKLMRISTAKAAHVKQLYDTWSPEPDTQVPAIDAFRGDIYSGLQAGT